MLTARKNTKVVRIITRLNIGGPAIHTILLSEGLDKKRFETFLVTGKADAMEGNMMPLAKEKNLKIEYIPEMGRKIGLRDIGAFFKLLKFLRKTKPDIVHTHTAKAGALGRFAAIFSGVPVKIHTFHGHVFDGYFSPTKARIFLWIEKILGKFTDRVVVVSKKVRDEIVGKLNVVGLEKCAVIPLGLELENFLKDNISRGVFRKSIDVSEDTLLVGIVGRLVPIKNHNMFLAAAKRVKTLAQGFKVKFVIVGDGELKESIKERIKSLGLNEDVVVVGWVKDLAGAYADLDIVALTSLNEGTPVAIIEAMASGRPVIATDVGGVSDVIQDGKTGILVKSDAATFFADEILKLAKDRKRMAELGSRGRDAVKEKYSKQRLLKDMEALYSECIAAKARS